MLLKRNAILVLLAANLPFLLARPDSPLVAGPLARSLLANLALLAAPGLAPAAWLLRGRERSPLGFLWVLAASAALGLAAILLSLAAGPPDAARLWSALWLLTNAGAAAWLAAGAPAPPLPGRREALAGLALFLLSYAGYYRGATAVVPPMEDHDYETQGTGWGLLSGLRPALRTDRGTDLYFAHPPLLHFWVAGSFAAWNRLDRLAAYAGDAGVERLYERFRRDPAPLPTRAPNVFLAALTVALLGAAAARFSGRAWVGALAAAAYASGPEVFVRSSYGGYFAIGQLAVLFLLLAEDRRDAFLAGAFAALADHKLAFLPLALAAWEWRRARRLHPAAAGFAAGTALFWAWGLSVDAGAFWLDHVRTHLLDRAAHVNPLGYGGYPGPFGLWLEFVRHTGVVLVPLGAWATAELARRETKDYGAWALWMLLLGAAFTVVDWRQTKHLTPLLIPLLLAPARRSASSRATLRATAAVLLFLVVWNLRAVAALGRDFASFTVTPAW